MSDLDEQGALQRELRAWHALASLAVLTLTSIPCLFGFWRAMMVVVHASFGSSGNAFAIEFGLCAVSGFVALCVVAMSLVLANSARCASDLAPPVTEERLHRALWAEGWVYRAGVLLLGLVLLTGGSTLLAVLGFEVTL